MTWSRWTAEQLEAIRDAGQWRTPRTFDARGPEGLLAGESGSVVSFASNDYLGLTGHPEVRRAAAAAIDRWGTGSGAARLVVGSRPIHDRLEAELADWKQSEAAVVFPTGFAANLGVLTTFGRPGARILSDELNHASIVDGARLARADVEVYQHRDLDHLDDLLARDDRPAIVVSDVVFSMDGDLADVEALVARCADRQAMLVLDEAHAVLGRDLELGRTEVLRVGTLSKSLASLGGFVAGSRPMIDLLVNRARSYIFTTASTPADAAAALAALEIVRAEEGDRLRARLASHVERLAPGHPSPIIPVVVGAEADALTAAEALLSEGLLVPAIRPPTVPPGTARLRIALSAAHTPEQVDHLASTLDRLGLRGSVAAT
jgi:8-amino-7-oxononanoate synthase